MSHDCYSEEELSELRPGILAELRAVDEEYPGDLIKSYRGLITGHMIGDIWVSSTTYRKDCGCFYGHLSNLDAMTARRRATAIEEYFDPKMISHLDEYTPIQYIIQNVYTPGEICQCLAFLKECIEELHPEFLEEAAIVS